MIKNILKIFILFFLANQYCLAANDDLYAVFQGVQYSGDPNNPGTWSLDDVINETETRGFEVKHDVTDKRTGSKYTRFVQINPTSLKELVKLRNLSPAGAALTAALAALDYAITETDIYKNPPTSPESSCSLYYNSLTQPAWNDYSTNKTKIVGNYCETHTYAGSVSCGEWSNSLGAWINVPSVQVYLGADSGAYYGSLASCEGGTTAYFLNPPVATPEELFDSITGNLPLTLVEPIFSISGEKGGQAQPTTETTNDLTTLDVDIANGDAVSTGTAPTTTSTTTSTTTDDATGTTTTTTGSTTTVSTGGSSSGSTELTFPDFCTWTVVVCPFIDWVKEDNPPSDVLAYDPLGTDTIINPLDQTITVGSSGACPSPNTVTVAGSALTFSYQPFCDFATLLNPLLVTFAYLSAAFIIVRV